MSHRYDALRADLIAHYHELPTNHFIAKHGVKTHTVYGMASLLGLTHNKTWEGQKDAIIAEYEARVSIKEIAAKWGHSQDNVKKRLIEWGVDMRSQSVANRQYALDETVFERIDSHEKAYWLGFIYADGNVYLNQALSKYVFQVALSPVDREHMERLRIFMKTDAPLHCDRGNPRLAINSIKITNDLQRLGVTPRKSCTLTFPSSDQVPHEFTPSFILGYFDGDGSINADARKWHWRIIGTDAFNTSVQSDMIVAIGLSHTKLARENRCAEGRLSYLQYSGTMTPSSKNPQAKHHLPRLYSYLYQSSPIWLPRKRERFETYLRIRYPDGWKHLT